MKVVSQDGSSTKQTETRVDKKLEGAGKYEITHDTTFRIRFWLNLRDGRWVIVPQDKKNKYSEEHWVDFRMWTFEEEIDLRKKATSWDGFKRIHLIDHDQLNRMKIQLLMKAWSFDAQNDRLKLLHVNDILSDESYKSFCKLQPNISRHIIERMNDVLDYNE